MNRFGRIALKTILWIIGSVIALLLLLILLIRLPSIQNYVVGQVTNYLEDKIGTPVDIGYINITFPKKIVLENVYFEDQSKDTLIAGEKLLVDINMFKLLKNTVQVQEIQLKGITGKIKRSAPSGDFNFTYIINAFDSEQESTTKSDTVSALIFDINDVLLENIHFVYHDDVIGTSADIRLKKFNTKLKKFDLSNNMAFSLPNIELNGLDAIIKQWDLPKDNNNLPVLTNAITESNTSAINSLLPDIDIQNIKLTNISVQYQDSSSSMYTHFNIKKLNAGLQQIDLNKEVIHFKDIELDESDSKIVLAKINKIDTDVKVTQSKESPPINWIVSAQRLTINKTNLWFKDNNQPQAKGFDYFNIKLTNLGGELNNFYYSADSISGSLPYLTVKDHSGFTLKNIQGDFIYTNTGLEIKNLLAQTPTTTIRDYISIAYPSLDDLTENPHLVKVKVNIKKSIIDMRDLNYFAPDLKDIEAMRPILDQKLYINGSAEGKLDYLNVQKFDFKTGERTHLLANAVIKGLPDIEKLNIDLDLQKLITGRKDLEQLISQSLLPDSLQLPNAISLVGKFTGGMQGFDTHMNLVTEKGNASLEANILMGRDTTYNATVFVDDLNIGSILNQDSLLGNLSFGAKVVGTGLDPKTMITDIESELNQLDAMGYTYKGINLNLQAKDGDIAGLIQSPDPNVQFNMDFAVNMHSRFPKVQANLMLDSINLKNLKIMNDDFRYHGRVIADFETANPDFLNGTITISNSSLAYNDTRLTLDDVLLKATADSNRNTLILNSEFLRAHLVGRYKLTELSSSVKDIIYMYYNPQQVAHLPEDYSAQNFEFSATLNHSRFIRDLLPELEEMQIVTLDGTFNSNSKNIMAKLLAPKIVYDGTVLEDISLDVTTADSTLYYSALIEKVKVGNIQLNNSVFSGSVIENNLDFGLWIKDLKDKERYHLGATASVNNDNYIIRLKEDGLMLNYDKWNITSDNQLLFGPSGIHAHNFLLSNKGQEFLIQSQDSSLNSTVDLSFKDFRIETFTKILDSDDLNVGGNINGYASLFNLSENPMFTSDIHIDKFYFAQDTIGNILIGVNNTKKDTYSADIRVTENGNDIKLIGDVFSPANGKSSMNGTLTLSPMKLATLEAFSMGYLKGADGDLEGKLELTGALNAPKINGELLFKKSQLNIAMLNADFMMDNQKIQFNDKGIQFKQFQIQDLRGNTARINGAVLTNDYTDFDFNLNLTTDDFSVVNSTREDNELFFGKLFVTSNIRITGDMHKPRIDGTVKANNKTDFSIIVPNENPGVSQRDGVVKFVNRSDTTRTNVFARLDSITTATHLMGYDIALNLATDKDAKFRVILDEGTQDALNIQGVAELTTTIDANNRITMSGTFTVEKGDYSFSMGPISKDFSFQKGSTITWNGDPLDAQLNITALYSNRFSTLELVQSQIGSESQNLYKQRIPFDVKLILTGELFKPIINFDIDLDENNAIVSQDVVSKVNVALANLREDPAELNKQVFSLIALGRFMAANPFASLSGGSAESLARSTVSSFLSSQLNSLASNLITGVELDFNLQSEEDYLTGNAQTRTDLNVDISKMLFDDRLKITIGSNFEVEGNTRPGERASNIAGDISLEYQLSKDGRYFARVYRKNQYQATLQGEFVETGIGFIINMSYDKFKELFMNSKALESYYNQDSRNFRRRFDVERMETDSAYRDSVRIILRDSLIKNNPEFKKRWEERQREELNKDKKQNNSDKQNIEPTSTTAIRNEEEERKSNEN